MSRNVYIIAGPNGVGKTTFAREFLPEYADCKNFINADLIAGGVAPLSPETAALRAGRLMLEEINRHAKRGEDFGFETTFAGRTHLALIRRLKKQGYHVHFFFLAVRAVELTLTRIEGRARNGGHNIPEPVVRRRFARSLRNFFTRYSPLADSWILFDNSGATPVVVAFESQGERSIINEGMYSALARSYGTP